jgi:methylated-DNA-[protein]-cysteine S-methyltransferase
LPRLIVDVIPHTPAGTAAVVWDGTAVVAAGIGAATVKEAIEELAKRCGGKRLVRGKNPAGRQLREYFAGRRRSFDLKVRLDGLPAFTARALAACARVPFGRTVTYGRIAREAGSPAAARAAGQAIGRNPIAIIIPCHRVVGAGGVGGFSAAGGVRTKKALLAFESERAGKGRGRRG